MFGPQPPPYLEINLVSAKYTGVQRYVKLIYKLGNQTAGSPSTGLIGLPDKEMLEYLTAVRRCLAKVNSTPLFSGARHRLNFKATFRMWLNSDSAQYAR